VGDHGRTSASRSDPYAWAAVWIALAILTLLAQYRLRDFPAHPSWRGAAHGIREVIAATGPAAIRVWIFWAWAAAVLAGFALKIDPGLDVIDAALTGAAGLWVAGYFLANLLAPVGAFNGPVLWLILGVGTVCLWYRSPPLALRAPTSGEKMAALAVALLAVSYLPLQLASPVPPFMDVLNIPSSVQQLLTFHVYLPYDDNPYGVFGVYNRAPALELFYATLAFGSHIRLAVLAETAAMLPMAALMMFVTWRLGKALLGDTAGGAAALLLFFTCLLRRSQGMRPTAVALVMVGIALAFFCDRERRRSLMAFGAIFLGVAIPSHAILGAFAMAVAGAAVIFWAIERDWSRVLAGIVMLIGALLIGLTDVPVALEYHVAYPALPILMIAGVAVIAAGARLLRDSIDTVPSVALRAADTAAIAVFMLAAIYLHHSHPGYLFDRIADNLPLLTILGAGGLILAAVTIWGGAAAPVRYAGLAAVALLAALVWEYVPPVVSALQFQASAANMVSDVGWKLLDYWAPYFVVLPAGFLFAVAYDRLSRPVTFFVLLAILIYPWRMIPNPADFDSAEHSIPEHWAFNLDDAAQGYWAGHIDRRWTFGPEEFKAIGVLNREIAAGRITAHTHILHLADNVSSWGLFQYPILTGINDDPIVNDMGAKREGWLSGSRVSRMPELAQELAKRPLYIIEQVPPPPWLGDPPPGYDKIFSGGEIRIFRRRGLTPRAGAG
jgi:hypothetical protein